MISATVRQQPITPTAQPSSARSQSSAPIDNYDYISVIGQGSFGRICKVRRKSDLKIVARKEITYKLMKEKEKRQLVQEVNILRELKHTHIVRYYERYVDRENYLIYIIMEFCEGGDLASVIKKTKAEGRHFPEDLVWRYLSQLVDALYYCHHSHASRTANGQSILHRDLKPDNVFLDANNNAKLGDFGLSTTVGHPEHDFARTFVGTPYYMSPELVNETSYNVKSDIWALGCLIYELCALEPPFTGNSHRQLHDNIRSGRYPSPPSQYSLDLRNVIRHLLCVNPEKRPSAAELIKHPRIQHTLREKEYEKWAAEVKRREEEVKRREQQFNAKEEEFRKYVQQVEDDLKRCVEAKEKELSFRENAVLERERKIAQEMQRVQALRRPHEDRNRHLSSGNVSNGNGVEHRKQLTPRKHAVHHPIRTTRYSENFATDIHKSLATMDITCMSMDISPAPTRTGTVEFTGGADSTHVTPINSPSRGRGQQSSNIVTPMLTDPFAVVTTNQAMANLSLEPAPTSGPGPLKKRPLPLTDVNSSLYQLASNIHRDFSVPTIHSTPTLSSSSSSSDDDDDNSSSSSKTSPTNSVSASDPNAIRQVSTSASVPSSVFKVPARLAKNSAHRRYSIGNPT